MSFSRWRVSSRSSIGGRTFTIVGGVAVDEAFLARLARDRAIVVSLRYPGARAV